MPGPSTSTSPNVYDDERLLDSEYADFRCESCEGRYPFRLMVVEDGHRVCRPNCSHITSLSERERIIAEASIEATELTVETERRNAERLSAGNLYSLMDGVSACTKIQSGSLVYPDPIVLIAGGSPVALVLTGIGFTTSDVLTASHAGITYGSVSISADQTTYTTTVVASGAVPQNDYTFLFNGGRFPYAFRVR